jgi:monothiol glutaredoxin
MDIFEDLGVNFETRDVLSDPEIREGVKEFTQWPTIPQIFINGEFVGGCDIVTDLYTSGELKKMVEAAK